MAASPAADDERREKREQLIRSLERDSPEVDTRRDFWPEDLFDFTVWVHDDEIVDYFDSRAAAGPPGIRPPPFNVSREGTGDLWDCKVCSDYGNRDPVGRELWVGARVEAAASGTRVFYDAIVTRIRQPKPDAFGVMPADAATTYDVRFDNGKRTNCDFQRIRIPSKCRTCGRPKGHVPCWEKGKNFIKAVKVGNLPVVAQLVEAGEDLEQLSLVGDTPLMLAASGGKDQIVRYLLSLQVSTGHQNQEQATALALASRKGHAKCVRALLDVDPTQCAVLEGLGRTPVALAAAGGHAPCVKLLCEAMTKSDQAECARLVNLPDQQGLTPFFKAAAGAHVDCMKILLDYGANHEALAQSMVLTRDRRQSSVVEKGLFEVTPDGRDARVSKALGSRYRMV